MASCRRRRRPQAPPSSWDDDGSSKEKTESRGVGSRGQKGPSSEVGVDGSSAEGAKAGCCRVWGVEADSSMESHESDLSWCRWPGAGPRSSGSRNREPREVMWPSPSWEEVGMVLEPGGSRGHPKAWSRSWAGRDKGSDPGVRLCSLNARNSRERGSEVLELEWDEFSHH